MFVEKYKFRQIQYRVVIVTDNPSIHNSITLYPLMETRKYDVNECARYVDISEKVKTAVLTEE